MHHRCIQEPLPTPSTARGKTKRASGPASAASPQSRATSTSHHSVLGPASELSRGVETFINTLQKSKPRAGTHTADTRLPPAVRNRAGGRGDLHLLRAGRTRLWLCIESLARGTAGNSEDLVCCLCQKSPATQL